MADMNTFEQQIAAEVVRGAGPSEPVDDLAVFEAVTAATRPRGWGSITFSALKLIAAAAIVALFGGFLLSGVLTTPQSDDVLPAAETGTPTPTTTGELLSGMVTEEVEAGVYRVVNDGVRDLTRAPGLDEWDIPGGEYDVVAGLDGSVWVFSPNRSYRLGAKAETPIASWGLGPIEADIEVGRNGRLWLLVEHGEGSTELVTFPGRMNGEGDADAAGDPSLPEHPDRDLLAVEVQPDGTVYGVWLDDGRARRAVSVGALRDGWVEELVIEERVDDWADGLELRQEHMWPVRRFWDLAVSGEEVWLADPSGTLHRRTASGWQTEDPPFPPDQLAVGPDGTVWIQAGDFHGWGTDRANEEVLSLRLARLDDVGWGTWDREDGIPPVGPVAFPYSFPLEGVHAVAPDGSVWLAALDHMAGRECGGIFNFDGTVWTEYLGGRCIYDADITPDGAVWVQAGEVSWVGEPNQGSDRQYGPVGTYVITPEAVASDG